MNCTYNPTTPYATMMKGRPDEPASHQHVAVYSKDEYTQFRQRGWKPAKEFTEMCHRAMTRPKGDWS